MAAFTPYNGNGNGDTALVAALSPTGGITINAASIQLRWTADGSGSSVNVYDGSLASLGIGAGLLLTSGTTPGTSNTMPWFGRDNSGAGPFYNGDADIDTVVNTVFQTQSFDATTLSFDFSVSDPNATSVSFDLVFGSDEYPEWVDQFVDCAVVMVNGVNYALFNHDPLHPLSVVSANLAAGYFQDNEQPANALPIEYDGVSHVLKIVAPILPGGATNHIKIAIADTGDHIYDSGLFIANLSAGNIPGSGVVSPGTVCDDSANTVTGSAKDEYFDLQAGNDIAYAGAGDDIVVAGLGDDSVYGGSGNDQLKGDAGDDLLDGGDGTDTAAYAGPSTAYQLIVAGTTTTITAKAGGSDGSDTLLGVELLKFSDGLFSVDAGGTLVPVTDPGTTPPTNSPGTVFVTGVAAAGKTLNASVSDPDSIAGAVAYQWQSSADGGLSWTAISGAAGSSYTVGAGDAGHQIRAAASFIDGKGHAEAPVSDAKAFVAADDGDFTVELLVLAAPAGASVMNPLTTLLANAIALGVSPNLASQYVHGVLGISPAINLLHHDAWAALQASPPDAPPADAAAFAVEKTAVQLAVLGSLSGDQSGLAVAQAVVFAGMAGQTLDLSDLNDIAGILGLPADDPVVMEVQDRNWNIFEAAAVLDIDAVWTDILNGGLSTTLADLSVHLNQAPTGVASATLAPVPQGGSFTIAAATLLAGFSDADGDALSVTGLVADKAQVTANADGSFTIVPAAGYAGPVELNYEVVDGQGGAQAATQLFVVQPAAPVDHEATGTLTLEGSVREGATVNAGTAGITDADGPFSTSFQWQLNSGGTWSDIAGATGAAFVIPDDQSLVGLQLRVQATTTDPLGGSTGFTSAAQSVANVNDAPTGSVSISGTVAQGQTLSAQHTLADADGLGAITWQWRADGVDLATGPTLTLTAAQAGQSITLLARYTDALGTPEQVASAAVGFGVTLTGNNKANTLSGTAWGDRLSGAAGNDTLLGLAGDDSLSGGLGNDVLTGGTGADRFVFDAALKKNIDRISDFDHAADTIVLDPAVFSRFTSPGAIDPAQFGSGPAAALPAQYLVYDPQTGTLSYDADGSGPAAAVAFATLTGMPTLDWTDFTVG
jgi:Ca2+-binding RTX toxin-like protein